MHQRDVAERLERRADPSWSGAAARGRDQWPSPGRHWPKVRPSPQVTPENMNLARDEIIGVRVTPLAQAHRLMAQLRTAVSRPASPTPRHAT